MAWHVPGPGHAQGATLEATPCPHPPARPAGTLRDSASTTQSHEQRSGQDAVSAGRARARGRRGEVLAYECTHTHTPRLHQPAARAHTPASPRPKSRKIKDCPGEPLGGWSRGPPGAEGSPAPRRPPSSSRHLPLPSLRQPRLPRLRRRPRAGALRAQAARSAAGAAGRQAARGGRERASGRRPAPTQAAREGILGAGPAPSRVRSAGPRAASGRAASTRGRKTAAAAGVSRPGEAAGKLPSAAASPHPFPTPGLGNPTRSAQELGFCPNWEGVGGGWTPERSSRFPDPPESPCCQGWRQMRGLFPK